MAKRDAKDNKNNPPDNPPLSKGGNVKSFMKKREKI